jgi:site-specific recombinase XerD
MRMKAGSGARHSRQTVTDFVRRLGLSSSFANLRILGLAALLSAPDVSSKNKDLILRFLNHISPEVSERRLTFYTHKLRRLATWLGKDFHAVTEDDIRGLLTFLSKGDAKIRGGRFSSGTLHGYKVTLKRFYRWLDGDDEEYPRKVRWIKTSGDTTRIKEPDQLLTPEEILEMIRHARNPRDKALVSFLYESGARISELLSMKIRHLDFAASMLKATLPVSKTLPRTIPLVSCMRHVATWVNYHPLKDDPEAPLWSNCKGSGSKPLLQQTANTILKSIARAAGITKRVYPHLFRACSITHKEAAGWPEQAIKAFHGLSKDSKVMKHYSHLSLSNLEEIQRRMHNLETGDKPSMHRGVRCPACGRVNPLYVDVCECGLPTEIRCVPAAQTSPQSLESAIEERLMKRLTGLIETRLQYDGLMEKFMNALVEKAKDSPELLRVVNEIRTGIEWEPSAQSAVSRRS